VIRRTYAPIVLAAALLCAVHTAARADGIPEDKKPSPSLERAIDALENQEPPVIVAPAPAPIEQTPPPVAVIEPVPETRVVEVPANSSFFGFSIGAYDPVTHGKLAAAFNFEWQPGVQLFGGRLQPLFGAMATSRGSLLGYGGIGTPVHLGKRIFLMPSFSVGAYKDGEGVDLGRTLAFRVGTELAYEFDDRSRLGLNIHAITNGESFNRRDRTEVISLVYTTPTTLFSGRPRKAAIAPVAPALPPPANAEEAIDWGLQK
jgi:lipid A 3-O-deacylase